MSDCCNNPQVTSAKTAVCPVNGRTYKHIAQKTLLHQISKPWQKDLHKDYYYCSDADCDVVYFSNQGDIIGRDDIRPANSHQSSDATATVCYCFDVSTADIRSESSKIQIRNYIIEQTKNHICECSIRNPSGCCCLKDIK